jgi:hypothetical protein
MTETKEGWAKVIASENMIAFLFLNSTLITKVL